MPCKAGRVLQRVETERWSQRLNWVAVQFGVWFVVVVEPDASLGCHAIVPTVPNVRNGWKGDVQSSTLAVRTRSTTTMWLANPRCP